VVRPGSTAGVADLVAAARRHKVALVAQGGNTGLVGGGVPHMGEVVLSLRRLDDVGPVDRLAGQVTVGAGVRLETLQAHAAAAGLAFGVDLAARGSATVGGMVATNAGGSHVVRYGSMRSQVVGVEAVLGTGQVVSRLGGLVKDNTGYDLAQLLCGSEGTLGIVTLVRLALVPAPRDLVVGLLAVRSLAETIELASELRWALPGVRALELMTGESLRPVAEHLADPLPVTADAEAYLLVEADGGSTSVPRRADPAEDLIAAVASTVPGTAVVLDSAVATAEHERARLWRYREAHSEVAVSLARERSVIAHKLDVTLPTAGLARFCHDVVALAKERWPGSEMLLFGHVGDGNLHVNVIPPAGSAGEGIDAAVLELVMAQGGSISAEHGIGVAKKPWLERNRSVSEVDAMRAIKAALDPAGILNPHVLFGR
jgi:FAD/FMN-containing dehydrogenase